MDREDPNKLEIKHIVRELTAIEIPEDANNIMFDSFQIMNRIIILRLNIKDNKFSFFLKDNLNCIDPNEYYSDQSIKELMFKTVMLQSELDIS